MKKLFITLSCALLLMTACSKEDDGNKTQNKAPQEQTQKVKQTQNKAKSANEKSAQFFKAFNEYSPAQKYYFCAAFAMGAMSVAKPVTASAMVNYFMGLGVAKYNVGITEDTYKAFNAGKNTFRDEEVVNTILKKKVCEDIMNEAADFARVRNYHIADLDKRGKKEVEKVVKLIKKKQK